MAESKSLSSAVIFGLIGFFILVYGLHAAYLAWDGRTWPVTEGQILISKMKVVSDAEGTDDSPVVRYRYSVNKRTYTGTRIGFRSSIGGLFKSRKRAEEVLKEYLKDSSVSVYFHQDNPQLAVLKRGIGWDNIVYLALGATLSLLGLISIIASSEKTGLRCSKHRRSAIYPQINNLAERISVDMKKRYRHAHCMADYGKTMVAKKWNDPYCKGRKCVTLFS